MSAQPTTSPDPERTSVRVRPRPTWQPALVEPTGFDSDAGSAGGIGRRHDAPRFVQESLAVDLEPACDPVVAYTPVREGQLADVSRVLPGIVLGMLEAMDGVRPVSQVSRWFAPAITERITRRGVVARRRGARPQHATRVLKVRVCRPATSIAEASVVVSHAGRVRAIALRLVGVDGRWIVTALEMA